MSNPTPPDVPSETTERPVTHSKKAQVTAIALGGIVVVGLVIQSYANMTKKDVRDQKNAAADQAKAAEIAATQPEAKLMDFTVKQKEAQQIQSAEQTAATEKKHKDKLLAQFSSNDSEAGAESTGAPKKTAATVAQDFALTERLRALQAGSSGIGKRQSSSAQSAGPTGPADMDNQQEIAQIDAKIAQLTSNSDITQRRNELVQRAQANGISLPDSVLSRLGTGSSGTASSRAPAQQGMQRQSAQVRPVAEQQFGELASNRAARDPGNAGPAPGEKLIPTGTILSAITDVEMISDYAGNWVALIQRPVYDVELEYVLLPAGTKIVGKSMQATGPNEAIQSRMGSVPLWAIRPDGKRIDFKRTASMDSAGVAALADKVDRHFLAQFFGVGAYALIGLGPSMSNYGAEPNTSRDAFIREATAKSRDVGRTFAEKYLNIVPTVKIRAGTPMKIFVEDDIYVTPWESADAPHYKIN